MPAARPEALITTGKSAASTKACAAACSLKLPYLAVGMLCRAMKSFEYALDASSCAAAAVGPKQGKPAAVNWSTAPITRGASGPTTTRPTPCSLAKPSSAGTSSEPMARLLTLGCVVAVPPLPGATKTPLTRGDSASLSAMACSRPPEPRRSTSSVAAAAMARARGARSSTVPD